MSRAEQRRMLLALLHARKWAAERRRQLSIAKRKARRRHLEEFEQRQYLECVAFIVFLLVATSQTVDRHIWVKNRSSDWWNRIVMLSFTESDWLGNFRMGKDTFMYVCNQLRSHIERKRTTMRQPISVEKRVGMTIWRLATNVDYRTIGHLFGISRASVCCIVKEVCTVMVKVLMPMYIKWPEGDCLQQVIDIFEHKWGYPQCGGVIDGSHIPIIASEHFHTDFFNRKGWHSIILQGVVDGNYRFTDVTVGWPESVHDARVFCNSSVYEKG